MARQRQRKLFCELNPLAYQLSTIRCRMIRSFENLYKKGGFAQTRQSMPLPYLIYQHNSLIRRRLGQVDPVLQENKAVNLRIAAPKVSGILIRPGETFSFWALVGSCTEKKGYRPGLIIANGRTSSGVGGGMCQFTNLLHWLVLHSPLTVTELHHHDGLDLFPDFGRVVPFGTGTSILYNYLDYRFANNTLNTYQLVVYNTEEYLHGELRCDFPLPVRYHIHVEDEYFSREPDGVYRNGRVIRRCVDKHTGKLLSQEVIKVNHAKVMYDTSGLTLVDPPPASASGRGSRRRKEKRLV